MHNLFDLSGKVAVVTGGAGFLGLHFCEWLLEAGATVFALDVKGPAEGRMASWLEAGYGGRFFLICTNVAIPDDVRRAKEFVLRLPARLDILVNNACNNPPVEDNNGDGMGLAEWEDDLNVGLTSVLVCAQEFGKYMARNGGGVILNIGSEYGIIVPDQRLYDGHIKPASYPAIKHGLIGLTRWLATYYAGKGVRVNCLSPGGVYNNQPPKFIERYEATIPLGRMARPEDLKGPLLFLCSDASAFMTGANLVVDGGRSIW